MTHHTSIIQRFDRPITFYLLATLGPWTCWGIAAFISHRPAPGTLELSLISALELIGLCFPMLAAWMLIRRDPVLVEDLLARLARFTPHQVRLAVLGAGIMLASILLGQAISLLFGHSAEQFRFSGGASFSAGIMAGWVALLLAPLIEELSWHSYGTDTLRRHMNVFWTSIVFGVYWVFWHAPLGFIQGYYQANVAESGWIYSLNFALSLIPFVLLMNWLYYKSGRNIWVAAIFHLSAGVFNEIFLTHPDSKVIQTGLLLVLTAVIVLRDRAFFFDKGYAHAAEPVDLGGARLVH